MNFPFYIAKRYVVAKKSHNAINIIATISILGITGGTIALIVILSIFNGFDDVVRNLFNSFYADLEIKPMQGKTFIMDENLINSIKSTEGVLDVGQILEDNALIVYGDKQTIGIVRGVDCNYARITGIDTMMFEGTFVLENQGIPQAIVGRGIKFYLNVNPDFLVNLKFYVPRRTAKISMDPNKSLKIKSIRPSGSFTSQPEIDAKYVLVPLSFAKSLFDNPNQVSSLLIRLKNNTNHSKAQNKIQQLVGKNYAVKNRIQQNELLYKTMKTEKWAIFFILTFILIIAALNVIGSLTMLIIEKKNDIQTLRNLGASIQSVKKAFLYEGLIIAFAGAILGLLIGSAICLLQQRFGFVKLPSEGSYIINEYPVKLLASDIFLVFFTVSSIGFMASWYPVRYITKKYLTI